VLVEQSDFAKGTSSRSTKLAHGGVRYLRSGEIGLVRGALRERGLMERNAPHLVRRCGFVIPIYRALDLPRLKRLMRGRTLIDLRKRPPSCELSGCF